MSKIKFFIDTADEKYISQAWDFLSKGLTGKEIVGITTNPNAMSKCDINTIQDFEIKVKNLCKIVSNIRGDDKGVVYVQHPNSEVSIEEFENWIHKIMTFTDGQTKVGIKIPPYLPLLNLIEKYKNIIDFNVTGVADCSTAMFCFTYLPRYVSLIPGRMEEKGIDAVSHMKFIHQRKEKDISELITGSMRTIEGLKSAVQCNTVPTIGTRVFDSLFNKELSEFINIWDFNQDVNFLKLSPTVNNNSLDLSIAFFNQMDEMGNSLKNNLNIA